MIEQLQQLLEEYQMGAVVNPRADIYPSMIIQKSDNGYMKIIDTADEMFIHENYFSTEDFFKIESQVILNRLDNQIDAQRNISWFAKISNLLQNGFGGNISAKVNIDLAKKYYFDFDEITYSSILEGPLLKYIKYSKLAVEYQGLYEKKLYNNDIYIITATLKAKSIKITESAKLASELGINVKQDDIGEINTQFANKSNDVKKLIAKSGKPKVFAYRAVRLKYKDGVLQGTIDPKHNPLMDDSSFEGLEEIITNGFSS